jgi:hypothetical protein
MKGQIHSVVFVALVAVLTGALLPISAPAAQVRECRAAVPASAKGHWSWRLIDGRKCWYSGKTVIARSSLRWPAAMPAQAKTAAQAKAPAQAKASEQAKAPEQARAPEQAKAAVAPVSVAPVSVAMEKRSEPMDAQARMLDDDNSFESRWRGRVTAE